MTQILKALSLSLAQLSDPRFRSVLLKGIGLAIALLAGIYAIVMWVVGWLLGDSVTLPFIGEVTWVDNVVSWGSIPLMLLLSTFLMVPVASAMPAIRPIQPIGRTVWPKNDTPTSATQSGMVEATIDASEASTVCIAMKFRPKYNAF